MGVENTDGHSVRYALDRHGVHFVLSRVTSLVDRE